MRHAVEILDLETKNDVGIGDVRRLRQHAGIRVQRMRARKIHPQALIFDGRLKRFRQLDQQFDSLWRASHASGDDHGVLSGDEHPGRFLNGSGIALRRRAHHELGDPKVLVCDRLFLQGAIGDDDDRFVGRRHRDLVSAHGGFGEVSQRDGRVVPLDEIAHHRRRILDAVHPLRVIAAEIHVENVAEDDVQRHAIGVAVEDGHGRVLKADVRHAP